MSLSCLNTQDFILKTQHTYILTFVDKCSCDRVVKYPTQGCTGASVSSEGLQQQMYCCHWIINVFNKFYWGISNIKRFKLIVKISTTVQWRCVCLSQDVELGGQSRSPATWAAEQKGRWAEGGATGCCPASCSSSAPCPSKPRLFLFNMKHLELLSVSVVQLL